MRRSRTVVAPLLASTAAALLAGCHSGPEMQRCVDGQNRVVDASLCRPGFSSGTGYHFYYGGRGSYATGSSATDGSATPSSGHSYSTTTGTSRGGFGGSFHASGGHGGGS